MTAEGSETPAYTSTPDLITSDEALTSILPGLAASPILIAVDTERASGFRYEQRPYLIQLKTSTTGIHLIDPVGLTEPALGELNRVLQDKQWILHSASQDLWALRLIGLNPQRIFDTELSARLLGREKVGLGPLVQDVLGITLAKEHGGADWSQRPLPQSWLSYAAGDVEFLIELAEILSKELADAGKSEWAEQEFAHILSHPTSTPKIDPWRSTKDIHLVSTRRGLALVRELWAVRDDIAQELDLAPHRVLHDRAISRLASYATINSVEACRARLTQKKWGSRVAQTYANEFTAALNRVDDMTLDDLPPTKASRTSIPSPSLWSRRNPEAAARWEAVRPALKDLAATHNLAVENLIAPGPIRALLWEPTGFDEVSVDAQLAQSAVRPWQRHLVVPVIVQRLEQLSDQQ